MEVYDGVPVWHASAALRSGAPLWAWSGAELREVRRVLAQALAGVGRDPVMAERGRIALHHRRWVTDAERLVVGEPRDIRGSAEEARRLAAVEFVLRAHGMMR